MYNVSMPEKETDKLLLRCSNCGEDLPAENFYTAKKPHSSRGYRYSCKQCEKDKGYGKKLKENNPEYIRNWHLQKRYGISSEQYEHILSEQGYCCAICKVSHSVDNKLHVDHCHKTGMVRGLLCGNCNRGLGVFKDNKTLLENAARYLDNEESAGR